MKCVRTDLYIKLHTELGCLCLDKHKSLPFHDRQIFNGGYYGYVPSTTGVTDDGVLMTISKFSKKKIQQTMIKLSHNI